VLLDLKDTRDLINSLAMDRYAAAFRLLPTARKLLRSGETPDLRVAPVGDLRCGGGGDEPNATKEETARKRPGLVGLAGCTPAKHTCTLRERPRRSWLVARSSRRSQGI
jgi:hypothetical protein